MKGKNVFNYFDYFLFAGVTTVAYFWVMNNILSKTSEWYTYVFAFVMALLMVIFINALKPYYNQFNKIDKYFDDLEEDIEDDDIKITKKDTKKLN